MSVTDYKELEGLLRIALFNDLAIQYWEKQLWRLVSTHSLTLYWRFFLFKNICAKPKVVHGREESSENSGVQTEERLNPGPPMQCLQQLYHKKSAVTLGWTNFFVLAFSEPLYANLNHGLSRRGEEEATFTQVFGKHLSERQSPIYQWHALPYKGLRERRVHSVWPQHRGEWDVLFDLGTLHGCLVGKRGDSLRSGNTSALHRSSKY